MTPTPSYYNPYIPLRSRLHHESIYSPKMMDDYSPVPDFKEPLSTTPPKLSLFSLPSKPSTLPDGPTPPPNMVANVPFLWEEAPGKPRITYITTSTSTIDDDPTKSKVVRSLDLPPRLTATTASPANYSGNKSGEKLVNNVRIQIVPSPTSTVLSNPYEVNNVRIQIVPSPTTVLSGPYEGHVYPSNTLETSVDSSSNSKITKGKMRMPLRKLMRKEKTAIVKFGSWRWQSFRDTDHHGGKVDRSPSSGRFCSWRWDSFADTFSGGGGSSGSLGSSFRDLHKSIDSSGKITRKNSFPFSKGTNSGRILASMFGTLKQAIPWRS